MISRKKINEFRRRVYGYYKGYGRVLPWRGVKDPYKVLVSELMLQQTQVSRVKDKYPLFLKHFPDFRSLAHAPIRNVLVLWRGLGYNRRALYLHQIAKAVVSDFRGKLPKEEAILRQFPGIGPGTAGAICAYAFNKSSVFIETNIRSVFIHEFFKNKKRVDDKKLIPLISEIMDRAHPREWYYALTDYGVYLKKQFKNPSRKSSHHRTQTAFKGSFREIRGMLLQLVLTKKRIQRSYAFRIMRFPKREVSKAFDALLKEGFIKQRGAFYSIARENN